MSYVSGAVLSGSLTFSGESLGSLGIAIGGHVCSLPDDTVRSGQGTTPIPLPADLPLLAGGLRLLAWCRRR